MELRSSRSRSRTPFVQLTRLENDAKTSMEQRKEETIVQQHYTTTTTRNSSTLSDEVFMTSVKHRRNRHKTSDYSSDDCDQEVSSRKSVETSSKNGEVTSALQVYKDAGEYWNKFPKTDYTYSLNSKDRVELAPGVVCMPNMSRKSLRRSMEPSNYDYEKTTTTSTSKSSNFYNNNAASRYDYHRNNLERKTLNFEDETDDDGYSVQRRAFLSTVNKSVTSVTTRFYRSVIRMLMIVYASVASSTLWMARGYYKTVSRLFLFDTWLMQKSAGAAATGSRKYGPLVAVMFLPLLLFAGWWLWSGLSQILHNKVTTTTTTEEIELEKLILTTTEPTIDVNNLIKILLSSPDFEQIIAKHLNTKHFNEQQKIVEQLQQQLKIMGLKNEQFHLEMKRCCRRQFLQIEGYVKKLLLKTFVDKNDVEQRFNEISSKLKQDFEVFVQKIEGDKYTNKFTNTLNHNEIQEIVAEALAVYDADKTGLVDYALESSGGQILSTRCTENYHSRTAVVSVLGIPLWYPSNTPRVVITPGVTPGECWAFQNFPGFLVIELSSFVRVSAFSVEHIPKSLVPGGHRDSAPKKFTVWGLRSENDHDPWDFGTFEYSLEGPALQYFAVKDGDGPRFNLVELRVESNHGNLNYTCLYRFRVHGSVVTT